VKITAPGMYGDGDGLWLQVREIGGGLSKTWIFRYMFAGRSRYMGLGPLRQVPLAKARARAIEARDLIYAGSDPIEHRLKRRDDARSQTTERMLFKDAAKRFLNLHRENWKNAKHRQQWENTLRWSHPPTSGGSAGAHHQGGWKPYFRRARNAINAPPIAATIAPTAID
jgi:hypothetical protein